MAVNSRQKGVRFERLLASKLREYGYQKKKSAESLLMKENLSHTPKARDGQTSIDSIAQDSGSVNRNFSERDVDSVSNRSLLADALESTVKDEIERKRLMEYKETIAEIEATQDKLTEIRAKIKELSFAKGPRDTKAIHALRFEASCRKCYADEEKTGEENTVHSTPTEQAEG